MPSWINGNLVGTVSVGQGERGKSLEYEWRGTELGIRVEGGEYQFVDLAGEGVGSGREIELQVGNGYIQWRYEGEEEWKNLISIDSLKGGNGKSLEFNWNGTELGVKQEGQPSYSYVNLKGKDGRDGQDGKQGIQGLPGRDGVDGKDGEKGADGVTPDIQIGTVTTLEAGEQATVVNSGTKENPVFDFGIPRGADGTGGGSNNSASIDDNTISTKKTWSSAKIENFVLANNNTIWKDVNGENLSIEHTKEGYLREVEILGNTIQNEENLEDIQHLGELYVDDDGKPKPDSQGRKQYRIEVETINKNLFRDEIMNGKQIKKEIDGEIGYYINRSYTTAKEDNAFVINKGFKSNTQYVFTFTTTSDHWIMNQIVYTDGTMGTMSAFKTTKSIITDANKTIKFITFTTGGENFIKNIQLEEGTKATDVVPHKSFKTTILLPCQLMKVGNISDRLYWDSSKGRYVVEKNVLKYLLADVNRWNNYNSPTDNYDKYYADKLTPYVSNHLTKGVSNTYKIITEALFLKTDELVFAFGESFVKISIPKNENPTTYLANSSSYILIGDTRNVPQLIETNITEELKLPTFINNTYISVTGGIQGSIKAKAPIDGGKVITVLQRENAEIKATNDKQDELINTTMLATDEMFMMLEPLLVELLNENSSSKMADMYVAMIKRGLKTVDQVPKNYRKEVKNIIHNKN